MNVLFFLEPAIELGNPLFRYATLRNSLIPQIKALHRSGSNVVALMSTPIAERAIQDRHNQVIPTMAVIDPLEWTNGENSLERAKRHQEENYHPGEVSRIETLIRKSMPPDFTPDLIIVWESPTYYLKEIFPDAKILYQMPGFFSRPPFANLISVDTGLLNKAPAINTEKHLWPAIDITELNNLQDKQKQFLNSISPLNMFLQEVRSKYDSIILFPLQIDGYFMIASPLDNGRKQFDVLLSILKEIPSNQALIVTNYKSRENNSTVLTDQNVVYLKSKFPNLYFEKEHDTIPYSSQFLVPAVDGVVTISSSVGYQAAYWKKPLLTIGKSHLTQFATASDLAELIQQAQSKLSFDRNSPIVDFLSKKHLPMRFVASDKYPQWLHDFCSTGEFRYWNENSLAVELAKESREGELLSQLGYSNRVRHSSTIDHCQELSAQIVKHDVISFDIFDTLLNRPLKQPADLFDLIENKIREISKLPNLNFSLERKATEKLAFELARGRKEGETTISEIYAVMADRLGLDEVTREKIMNVEMQAEYDLLDVRQSGYRAFMEAKSLGKRIILISDMYLPEAFLGLILKKNGFDGYERLFVSSTYKAKKHSGELFKVVIEKLRLDPKKVLHVGDNVDGDVKRAKAIGLKPFHLTKASEIFAQTSAFQIPWSRDQQRHSLDWRMLLAVIGNTFNDNPYLPERKGTLFGGDPWRLGYYGLGPLLLGYTKWLIETSQRDKVDRLYFLARDGKIMKDAYDRLAPLYDKAPSSTYLLCSRRAVNLAKATNLQYLLDLVDVDYAHNVTVGFLLSNRFGVRETDEVVSVLSAHNLTWKTKLNADDRPRLRALIVGLAPQLLAIASEERENYLAYLNSSQLTAKGKVAVVDIGYAGTMQESLHLLSKGKAIGGYYLITFRSALKRVYNRELPIQGFLANFVDRHDTYHPFCRNVPLFETLFSTTDTSFMRMARDWNGDPYPIFMDDTPNGDIRARLIRKLHSGALAFVDDIVRKLGSYLPELDIEPNKTLRVLDLFFQNPHPRDARILAGVEFEDAYGGSNKVILPQLDNLDATCVWMAGRAALLKGNMTSKSPPATSPASNEQTKPKANLVTPNTVTSKVLYWAFLAALKGNKKNKFIQDPSLFFDDANGKIIKKIGSKYLNGVSIK